MLRIDSLPKGTRDVFDFLSSCQGLRGFTLIGGTALALQIGHRKSEDLDFWLPADRFDKNAILSVIREAQNAGLEAQLITPHHRIVASKINGIDLLALAQDYLVGGVKVTFFARKDAAYDYFKDFARVTAKELTFDVMGAEGLFSMKSYVIHQRVRSRDLFDLKTFVERGKTLHDILKAAEKADPSCSPAYGKEVLIGAVPLDPEDEGFDSIGVEENIEDIHAFFRKRVDADEQAMASAIFLERVCEKCHAAPCVCAGKNNLQRPRP